MEFAGRTLMTIGLAYMGLVLQASSWGVYEYEISLSILHDAIEGVGITRIEFFRPELFSRAVGVALMNMVWFWCDKSRVACFFALIAAFCQSFTRFFPQQPDQDMGTKFISIIGILLICISNSHAQQQIKNNKIKQI